MSELPTPPNVPEWLEDILLLNPPSCRDCFRAAAYSLLWSDEAMLLETESFTILDMSVPNEEKRRLIEVHKQLEEAAHEKSELCATRFRELCK